jgi:hypothetical protein
LTAAALHAARQLVWHLRTSRPLDPPEWLTPAERDLFGRMAPPDQLEGLAVAATLRDWGWGGDRELLAGAALHDVGKSLGPAGASWRVLIAALETVAPGLLPPLLARSAGLAALWNHASTGAELARAGGLSDNLVALIGGHHQPPQDDRMRALQAADGLH